MEASEVYEVVSPVGRSALMQQPLTSGLDTLDGKTICELWNRDFQGDIMFPKIRELLQKRYRNVKIISYDEVVAPGFSTMGQGRQDADALKVLGDTLLAKGCDAVISGNGN
jgi:hypothetical protein